MFTVVWGWWSNMTNSEEFETREAAWERVKELMAARSTPWTGAPERRVCVLEVYKAREGRPGHEISSFRRYEAGSKYCRWGEWGVSKCLTSGELFG